MTWVLAALGCSLAWGGLCENQTPPRDESCPAVGPLAASAKAPLVLVGQVLHRPARPERLKDSDYFLFQVQEVLRGKVPKHVYVLNAPKLAQCFGENVAFHRYVRSQRTLIVGKTVGKHKSIPIVRPEPCGPSQHSWNFETLEAHDRVFQLKMQLEKMGVRWMPPPEHGHYDIQPAGPLPSAEKVNEAVATALRQIEACGYRDSFRDQKLVLAVDGTGRIRHWKRSGQGVPAPTPVDAARQRIPSRTPFDPCLHTALPYVSEGMTAATITLLSPSTPSGEHSDMPIAELMPSTLSPPVKVSRPQ